MSKPERLRVRFNQSFAAWYHRYTVGLGQLTGFVLIAQEPQRFVRWTNKLNVARTAHFREMRILRQKAVPGMDRFHVGDLRGADQTRDIQVAVAARRLANADFLVRQMKIGCVPIGFAEDGNDLDTQIPAGANDPQGNLTTIGNENSLEHRKPK